MAERVGAKTVFLARIKAQHTQAQAAALIDVSVKTWEAWEQEAGGRKMPKNLYELYLLRTQA